MDVNRSVSGYGGCRAHRVSLFGRIFCHSLLNVVNLCVAESYINVTTTAFNVQKFRFLNSENVAVKRRKRKVVRPRARTLFC